MLWALLHTTEDQLTLLMYIAYSKPREEPQRNGVGDASQLCTLLPNQQGGESEVARGRGHCQLETMGLPLESLEFGCNV